jgi:hypothetical protein
LATSHHVSVSGAVDTSDLPLTSASPRQDGCRRSMAALGQTQALEAASDGSASPPIADLPYRRAFGRKVPAADVAFDGKVLSSNLAGCTTPWMKLGTESPYTCAADHELVASFPSHVSKRNADTRAAEALQARGGGRRIFNYMHEVVFVARGRCELGRRHDQRKINSAHLRWALSEEDTSPRNHSNDRGHRSRRDRPHRSEPDERGYDHPSAPEKIFWGRRPGYIPVSRNPR